jgi:hypothetical protein
MPSFTPYTALVHGGWRLAGWVLAAGLLVAFGSRSGGQPRREARF